MAKLLMSMDEVSALKHFLRIRDVTITGNTTNITASEIHVTSFGEYVQIKTGLSFTTSDWKGTVHWGSRYYMELAYATDAQMNTIFGDDFNASSYPVADGLNSAISLGATWNMRQGSMTWGGLYFFKGKTNRWSLVMQATPYSSDTDGGSISLTTPNYIVHGGCVGLIDAEQSIPND